ncbi:MAG: hypothetical protein JWM47_592 [Acidimicrobiales bacterium]|nr:hypothetical protein [Acidimicrobiales bacterium]
MLAYLDAGTLPLIGAALAGGLAGVAMMLRMYGNKILGLFSKKRRIKAEMAEGELLGVEIDPATGRPVDPEAAAAPTAHARDDQAPHR